MINYFVRSFKNSLNTMQYEIPFRHHVSIYLFYVPLNLNAALKLHLHGMPWTIPQHSWAMGSHITHHTSHINQPISLNSVGCYLVYIYAWKDMIVKANFFLMCTFGKRMFGEFILEYWINIFFFIFEKSNLCKLNLRELFIPYSNSIQFDLD